MPIKVQDYLDIEAEEGSDNDDSLIKPKLKKKETSTKVSEDEEEDLNEDLDGLIDNEVHCKKSERKNLRKKFLEDELKKDKAEIKDIIQGNFKKKRKWHEVEEFYESHNLNEDGLKFENYNPIHKRKKLMTSVLIPDSTKPQPNFEIKKSNVISFIPHQNDSDFNADCENKEEDFEVDLELELKRKVTENGSTIKKKFNKRLKENEQILSNVINLNKEIPVIKKGVFPSLNLLNKNPFLFSQSQGSQNSVLNAIKKDKYYPKTFDYSSDNNLKDKNQSNVPKQMNNFQVFNNRKNTKLNSEKKKNISAIFEQSDKSQIIKR